MARRQSWRYAPNRYGWRLAGAIVGRPDATKNDTASESRGCQEKREMPVHMPNLATKLACESRKHSLLKNESSTFTPAVCLRRDPLSAASSRRAPPAVRQVGRPSK